MSRYFIGAAFGALAGLVLGPAPAAAQGLEALGARAAALGAFVAVADDASAVAWNPAGLATGPIFNITADLGQSANEPALSGSSRLAGGRSTARLVALSTIPLGLAYYRLSTTWAAEPSPAVSPTPGRQDRRVAVRTLQTHHVGATVLQSIGEYVTVGATLKLVRGRAGAGTADVSSWDEVADRAGDLETSASTRGDLDIGAMVGAGELRAGLVVRNVTRPTFGDGETGRQGTLDRHARAGAAWGRGWPGTARRVVAVDADLTRVPHPSGDRRDVAAGVEHWLGAQRLGLRAGARVSTAGAARPVVSGGASWAVRTGVYVDAQLAAGPRDDRAWNVGVRVTY